MNPSLADYGFGAYGDLDMPDVQKDESRNKCEFLHEPFKDVTTNPQLLLDTPSLYQKLQNNEDYHIEPTRTTPKMLYDLNIPWSPATNSQELQRTISFLDELGYSTIALNQILHGPFSGIITNPIPKPLPFTIPKSTNILTRATLVLGDPAWNSRVQALSSEYDIVAIRPTNKQNFENACNSLDGGSLISLDLTKRYDFHFKQKNLMTAINRGYKIEISYAQCTMAGNEGRKNFIGNVLQVVRGTKGKGLVITSEATGVLGIRAPADVVNLMAVWGLGRERGVEAMETNSRGVVVNEKLKRTSFRGVVDIIDGGEPYVKPVTAKGTPVNAKGKGKRKVEEETSDDTPKISKREQKRRKMAAQKATKEASSPAASEHPAVSTDVIRPADPNTPSIKNKANG